jgi:hypothetical protein
MERLIMVCAQTDGCTYNFETYTPLLCESKEVLQDKFDTAYLEAADKDFEFCGEEFSKYSLEELCGFPTFYTLEEWFKDAATV